MASALGWRFASSNGNGLAPNDTDMKIPDSEPQTPHSTTKMSLRERTTSMEDPDGTLASVAQCIEQLRQGSSSAQEREYCLKQLLDLIEMRENAFSAVGSHSQAVPVLVSLLRSGSLGVKIQAATVLGSLCKENELRVKVLLGGCIPPLLGLLKSSSVEGQIAAAKTIYAVSEAILFQDREITRANATMKAVPVLSNLVKSEEYADRYFAAQALASLVCNGSRGTLLSVANSGAAAGFISLLGCSDDDIKELLQLSQEFMLVRYPDQVALERLFRVEDIRVGATSRKAIPLLVELLKPIPDRPGAPLLALNLLTLLAGDCTQNMIVMVELLRSASENTVVGALNTLLVLESDDGTSAESMAESGAIEALLDLLRSHQCEDTAARLLEVLLNNVKIRDSKATKTAILPLSQYLLDPQTQAQQARLLATLALGDLFQNEALARSTDAASACRALVNVLEEQPTEEMKVVAICALQNLVMYSRSNKRAVAEAGGVQVVLDLISSSDPDTSVQAAMFVKLLFSNHTVQEYASSETVRAITAAIEKDLWATGTVNDEYLKALNSLFNNFPRLRATEPATLSIPHLVTSLKTGSEATQEAALDALFLLRQAWSACPAEVSRAQSVAAADAIPLLQYLIQSGPPRFQEKAEFLLQCLPGTLVVTIKRGNNMKQSVGNPSVFCKITLGNTPPRQTKVISTGPNPEWDESFSWSFESPPKGQKLHISCKNKSKMGKSSFGKVTIQIDRVVMLGAVAGEYSLLPESKSGPRNLEIEFQWSNK
ncbi:hypothetical protein BRARA_I04600 [Brassica rapa]|uniref:C2 domain-containing protein n=1 Tax=Brassica campestris TaxID=3711 RepID=A0A397Y8C1_BRACM|nr:hypothetical protein BRARA_I04600 [Brassica rapa]